MLSTRVNLRVLGLTLAQVAIAVALLQTATVLIEPAARPGQLPWWVLGTAYLAAGLLPAHYEVRGETRYFLMTQFALAVGLVFMAPGVHLLVRAGAVLVEMVAVRRQPPLKVAFNTSVAALEVAVATALASLLSTQLLARPLEGPGPKLWGVLLLALLVSELTIFSSMQVLFFAIGVRPTKDELRRGLLATLASALVFTGAAIVVVAAVWSDLWTVAVGGAVGGALAVGFRNHRRLTADQQQTVALHQFIKGLGPLDLDASGSQQVLGHVRTLLHARHLGLAVREQEGWRHYSDHDHAVTDAPDFLPEQDRAAGPLLGRDDQMSAPLVGSQELVGVLSVRSRLGNARTFGLRDLRLLETLAAELSTAIERGRLQRELAAAATTDALTGLPNLHETTRRLDALMEHESRSVLVATLAVDSFREVNDTLGHEVGDDLLREVTRRLALAYPEALTGRIGGGRFAVAMPARTLGGDPAMFGLGLRAQVEGGAQLGPVGTHVRLSVGCVRGPEHGQEAATLIRRAETAMYSARNTGGGPVTWEPAYEVEGQRRLAVVMALREALTSGAIGVGFQPKIATGTRAVTGVEALARWTHPALGAISPAEFVPLAEASGLMGPLTTTVLRQALTSCKGWQRRGGPVGVAVNVSAATILDPSFVTEVAAILTSVGIPAQLLTLELTEGVVVDDPGLAAERMHELRSLGVRISVDDFGTGYSSLTYLKGLPVDEVKIDKGFVDGIARDAADRAVVRAVVDIAHTLGLRVVAEGVEQEEQHALLTTLGVDEVQGYLHARPMAALDMARWLRHRDQDASVGAADR
jgi:diguanylate cyclase (GGDEF)-like protein